MAEATDIEARSEDLARQVATDVMSSLQGALVRLLGDPAEAERAMAEGACQVHGSTLAWRVDDKSLMVELFSDIGLPEPAQEHEAFRLALQANLCRTYPGLHVGLHPESRRLVATAIQPAVLVMDESFCLSAMEHLAGQALQIRAAVGL